MQAISVELLLAENDFMSDLREPLRGVGRGGWVGGEVVSLRSWKIECIKTACFNCSVDYWLDAPEAKLCTMCCNLFD